MSIECIRRPIVYGVNTVDIDPYWDSNWCNKLLINKIKPKSHLNLVLDVDQTMVCTTGNSEDFSQVFTDPKYKALRRRIYNIKTDPEFLSDTKTEITPSEPGEIFGILRPHLYQFLDFAFRYFENIYIWSSGDREYILPLCDHIFNVFPKKPRDIFTGDKCPVVDKKGNLGKPLKLLYDQYPDMNAANTIIIDDLLQNGKSNPDNLIKIPKYDPKPTIEDFSKDDTAFLHLIEFFKQPLVKDCADIKDVDKSNIFKR